MGPLGHADSEYAIKKGQNVSSKPSAHHLPTSTSGTLRGCDPMLMSEAGNGDACRRGQTAQDAFWDKLTILGALPGDRVMSADVGSLISR